MKELLHAISYTAVNITLLSLLNVCECVLLTDSNSCLIQDCICHYPFKTFCGAVDPLSLGVH